MPDLAPVSALPPPIRLEEVVVAVQDPAVLAVAVDGKLWQENKVTLQIVSLANK